MSPWPSAFKRPSAYLMLLAVLLPFGLCLILDAAAWKGYSVMEPKFWWREGGVGVLIVAFSLIAGGIGAWSLDPVESDPSNTEASPRFNRYLVGIGYALFVFAVCCCALVSGLIFSKRMDDSAKTFETRVLESPEGLATLIVLSCVVAVLGALFFVANSLRHKRDARQEPFSAQKFWGGLWYRLGEAILFSLVVFWLIWSNVGPKADSLIGYSWLPLLSLLMGMFVTSGEKLIFGIARGLFRAVGAFFTPSGDEDAPSGTPAASSVTIPDAQLPPDENRGN